MPRLQARLEEGWFGFRLVFVSCLAGMFYSTHKDLEQLRGIRQMSSLGQVSTMEQRQRSVGSGYLLGRTSLLVVYTSSVAVVGTNSAGGRDFEMQFQRLDRVADRRVTQERGGIFWSPILFGQIRTFLFPGLKNLLGG